MYEKYLNNKKYLLEDKDEYPGDAEVLRNLLYSLDGIKEHSFNIINNSNNIKGLSEETLNIAKDLLQIYKKYYKSIENDFKNQVKLIIDFYKNEGNESMVKYYETYLK